MDNSDIQKELDEIRLKDKVLKESDDRYARKLVEQVLFGILGLFGVAIVMKVISVIGL